MRCLQRRQRSVNANKRGTRNENYDRSARRSLGVQYAKTDLRRRPNNVRQEEFSSRSTQEIGVEMISTTLEESDDRINALKADLARESARLNYIEENFHVLGFTHVSYGWICIYNGDAREADNLRDMIDLMSKS